MKLLLCAVSGFAVVAMLNACSGHGDSAPAAPISPVNKQSDQTPEQLAQSGTFSVRENRNRDLGKFVSGQNDAVLFCSLVDVPNSTFEKLINIEAGFTWQSPDKSEVGYYRLRIESQSPREILAGKNNFDFVDANVRLYTSKIKRPVFSEFNAIAPDNYGCDISNLEKKNKRLSGKILCYKNNVYHGYNFRLLFDCALN